MNSLYQQLHGTQAQMQQAPAMGGNMQQVKNMMQMLKGAKNPKQLLRNMAQSNPQMQRVMDMVDGSKMNPKDLFYKMAKEKGVDPDQIVNALGLK